MSYDKKYIITGAPGTGKTTLINRLTLEYDCMPEISRFVILGEQRRGGVGTPWQDLDQFVTLVYDAFIQQLEAMPEALFTDRSLLDLIAYLQVEGKSVPAALDQFCYQNYFFKRVFFTPTWEEIYHKDAQRQQEFNYCVELEKALLETYTERGFDLCELPKTSVEERYQFIKVHLKP